jgi:site-specific DNA-methyltransferase (adenine-specific)
MDCLEGMKLIDDKSIDMILCDLPYGTTKCKWDIIIPFEPLWEQYERIIKDNGIIVLFGSQPFTSQLINSNIKYFRYEIIWEKEQATNFVFIRKQIGKIHENICVFYKKQPIYNPQMRNGKNIKYSGSINQINSHNQIISGKRKIKESNQRYPISIVKFNRDKNKLHPTQKPVALFEYLIHTYTNEGNLVLDNCMGSGTTAIACINTNRNYIGFELDTTYCDLANKRIQDIVCEEQ